MEKIPGDSDIRITERTVEIKLGHQKRPGDELHVIVAESGPLQILRSPTSRLFLIRAVIRPVVLPNGQPGFELMPECGTATEAKPA